MKKAVRLILILIAVALLAGAWIWRYTALNKYYDDLANGDYKLFRAGELVPFEDDSNDLYTDLNGYYIRVDGYKVEDYVSYLEKVGLSLPAMGGKDDKLALVTVTLVNESCEANPVMFSDMILHGVDTVLAMDPDVLVKANSILNGQTGIALEPGTQCQIILPYLLRKDQFEGSTWRRIEDYKVFLQVTSALTTKDIAVNG